MSGSSDTTEDCGGELRKAVGDKLTTSPAGFVNSILVLNLSQDVVYWTARPYFLIGRPWINDHTVKQMLEKPV